MDATLYKELSDAQEVVQIEAGRSIRDNFPGLDLSKRIILVNGIETSQDYIAQVDDIIMIRSVPHEIATVVIIALAVVVTVGVVVGGVALYKMKKQLDELQNSLKNVNESVRNIPYLRGAQNALATGNSQPYIIGEHLFTPYLITGTYSKLAGTDGADQYFYAVLENGFNKQVVRNLKCDDVVLKDWGSELTTPQEGVFTFDESSVFYDADSLIEVAQDGNAFATAAFNRKVFESSPGTQLLKADNPDYEDLIFTLPEKTRAAEVCILINGLRAYNDSGSKINRTVTVIPEYQLVDAGAWTSFTFDQNGTPSNTFTRNVINQLRFVARVDFTYAQVGALTAPVKIRLRCITNAYDGSARDDVYVQWIQSEIYDPIASATLDDFVDEPILGATERAVSTLVGLKIKVTASNEEKLSKINCISSGVARTWNGSVWGAGKVPTSNPAAWLLEVLTSHTHNASQADDSEIDLDSFGELYEYCDTNELAIDMVLIDGDTKESVLARILETCFAVLYRDIYGQISVAIDSPKSNAIALFNTQNVISFENTKSLGRRTDGVKISYVSRDAGYVQSSYLIMRSGVTRTSDSILRDVSVSGIVEYEHIVKYARRLMAIEALRPKTVSVQVGKEGIYYTPLSKVLIQHPSLKVGIGSAEIKYVIDNGTHITGLVLYEPVSYDPDNVNGFGAVIAAVGDDYYTPLAVAYTADDTSPVEIELVTPIALDAAVIPHAGDVLSYGTLVGGLFDLITTPMLIAGVTPNDQGHTLTLIDYDTNVYAVGDIPAYTPNFTGNKETISVPDEITPATVDEVETVKEIAVAAAAAAGGRYRGIGILAGLSTAPFTGATVDEDGVITPGSAVTPISLGDVMVNYSDIGGVSPLGIYRWTGSAWTNTGITSADKGNATNDLLNLSVGGVTTPDGTAIISLYVREMFAQKIVVPNEGSIRYETGSGVQKRTVQLADEKIDWLDTPDTSPASAEVLRARIGRLGVGPSILMDGEFSAKITPILTPISLSAPFAIASYSVLALDDGSWWLFYEEVGTQFLYLSTRPSSFAAWATPVLISGARFIREVEAIQTPNGEIRVAYRAAVIGAAMYELVRSAAGIWGSETRVGAVSGYSPKYCVTGDGTVYLFYCSSVGRHLCVLRLDNGEWSSPTIIDADFQSHSIGAIAFGASGMRVAYVEGSSVSGIQKIHEKVFDGGSWSSRKEIDGGQSQQPLYYKTLAGEYNIVYRRYIDGSMLRKTLSGTLWSDPFVVLDDNAYSASVVQSNNSDLHFFVLIVDYVGQLYERIESSYARIGAGIIETGLDGSNKYLKFSEGTEAVHKATAGTLMLRDSAGRSKAAGPLSNDDIATKGYVDALAGSGQYMHVANGTISVNTTIAMPDISFGQICRVYATSYANSNGRWSRLLAPSGGSYLVLYAAGFAFSSYQPLNPTSGTLSWSWPAVSGGAELCRATSGGLSSTWSHTLQAIVMRIL